jgi:hypothetical protein
LVLNTQWGDASPQFHCIYDDEFATCERDAKFTSLWQFKAQFQLKPAATDRTDVLPTLAPGWYEQYNINVPVRPPAAALIDQFVEPWDQVSETPDETVLPPADMQQLNEPLIVNPQPTEVATTEPVTTTRSGRQSMPRNRLIVTGYLAIAAYSGTFSPMPIDGYALHLLQPGVEAYAEPHPSALMTEHVAAYIGQSDPDTMTLDEALCASDRDQFVEAMKKERNDHTDRKHWKVIPASSVPKHKVPLPMVWAMKRKHNPVGTIMKWKARQGFALVGVDRSNMWTTGTHTRQSFRGAPFALSSRWLS